LDWRALGIVTLGRGRGPIRLAGMRGTVLQISLDKFCKIKEERKNEEISLVILILYFSLEYLNIENIISSFL